MSESHIITLEKKIDRVEKSVDEIKAALIGSDLTNRKGIVHDLADHDVRITKLEKKMEGAKWWLMGAGAALGISGTKLIEQFFK